MEGENNQFYSNLYDIIQDILDIYQSNDEWPQIDNIVINERSIKNMDRLVRVVYEELESQDFLSDWLKLTSKSLLIPRERWQQILQIYVERGLGRKIKIISYTIKVWLEQVLNPRKWEIISEGEWRDHIANEIRALLRWKWKENNGRIEEILWIDGNINRGYRVLLRCLLGIKCRDNNLHIVNKYLRKFFECMLSSNKNNCLQTAFNLGWRSILLKEFGEIVLKLTDKYQENWLIGVFDSEKIEQIKQELHKLGFKLE